MKNFLAQFSALTPAQVFKFDNYIYALGVKQLGRRSGMWASVKVGEVYSLRLGDGDAVNLTPDGRVRVETIFGSIAETDALTASVAFTMLVVNWFWNANAVTMSEEANEQFSRVHFGLRDGAFADNSNVTLDQSALFTLTD